MPYTVNMLAERNNLWMYVSSVDIMLLLTFVYVIQSLSPALIDIRKMCYQLSDTGLCHMERKHTYTLQEFKDIQFIQLQEVQMYTYTKIGPDVWSA